MPRWFGKSQGDGGLNISLAQPGTTTHERKRLGLLPLLTRRSRSPSPNPSSQQAFSPTPSISVLAQAPSTNLASSVSSPNPTRLHLTHLFHSHSSWQRQIIILARITTYGQKLTISFRMNSKSTLARLNPALWTNCRLCRIF